MPDPLRSALASIGLAGMVAGAAPAAPSPAAVRSGELELLILRDGAPVADPDLEVAIRTLAEESPRIVVEGQNQTRFHLPEGEYDCLVSHRHLPLHPLRYHRFEIRSGPPTRVVSDVRTFELVVQPVISGIDSVPRDLELRLSARGSGASLTRDTLAPLALPEGAYHAEIEVVGLNGERIRRARDFYLRRPRRLQIELGSAPDPPRR